jgi:hypothetical protein
MSLHQEVETAFLFEGIGTELPRLADIIDDLAAFLMLQAAAARAHKMVGR